MTVPYVAVVLAMLAAGAEPGSPAPTRREVRSAIERSLPFLEGEGVDWMQVQGCNSCHRVPFLLWSHHEALSRGVAVDRKALDEWTRWALDDTFEDRRWFRLRPWTPEALAADGVPGAVLTKLAPVVDKTFQTRDDWEKGVGELLAPEDLARHGEALRRRATLPNNGGGPDTLSQLILARAPLPSDGPLRASYESLRRLLLEWQEPDGQWVGQGQQPDQRRPRSEMSECTTMWAVLALSASEELGEAEPGARARDRALAWLEGGTPGVSTESLALRAVVDRRFGAPARADRWLADLLGEQKADGGWSWVRSQPTSDAFATGQVLYALGLLGRTGDDPAVRRAWSYLLRTQGEDGAWDVHAAPISSKTGNALAKMKDGYIFWGTAWAVIGLSRTLPESPASP